MKDSDHGALPGESFDEAGRDVPEGLEMARRLEKAGFDACMLMQAVTKATTGRIRPFTRSTVAW
jgi:hypothetical protein